MAPVYLPAAVDARPTSGLASCAGASRLNTAAGWYRSTAAVGEEKGFPTSDEAV